MKTLSIEAGIVYKGKLFPWEAFNDVLCSLADQKTTDKLNKKIKDLVSFTPILINQNTNNNEIAEILGLKVIDNTIKLRKNILLKIAKFNDNHS